MPIGCLPGLRSADPVVLDMVRAYGGGRWACLVKVRVIAARPATLTALKISAPSGNASWGRPWGGSRGRC